MAKINIIREEDLGESLIKQVNETYVLPENISCPYCSKLMTWDSYHSAYICHTNACEGFITGRDFVENRLAKIDATKNNENE